MIYLLVITTYLFCFIFFLPACQWVAGRRLLRGFLYPNRKGAGELRLPGASPVTYHRRATAVMTSKGLMFAQRSVTRTPLPVSRRSLDATRGSDNMIDTFYRKRSEHQGGLCRDGWTTAGSGGLCCGCLDLGM